MKREKGKEKKGTTEKGAKLGRGLESVKNGNNKNEGEMLKTTRNKKRNKRKVGEKEGSGKRKTIINLFRIKIIIIKRVIFIIFKFIIIIIIDVDLINIIIIINLFQIRFIIGGWG